MKWGGRRTPSGVAHDALGRRCALLRVLGSAGRAPPRDEPSRVQRIEGGVPMLVLILDIDCAAAHKAQGGTEGVRADDAWWSVERTRIARIQRATWRRLVPHRGGARGVYRLLRPSSCAAADGSRGGSSRRRRDVVRAALRPRVRPVDSTGPAFIVCPSSPATAWRRTRNCSATRARWDCGRNEPTSDEVALDPPQRAARNSTRSHGLPRRACSARTKTARARARMPRRRAWSRRGPSPWRSCGARLDLGRAIRGLGPPRAAPRARGRLLLRARRAAHAGPRASRAICAASGETTIGLRCGRRRPSRPRARGRLLQGYGRLRGLALVAERRRRGAPLDGGVRAARDALDGSAYPRKPATEAAPPGARGDRARERRALRGAPPRAPERREPRAP